MSAPAAKALPSPVSEKVAAQPKLGLAAANVADDVAEVPLPLVAAAAAQAAAAAGSTTNYEECLACQ